MNVSVSDSDVLLGLMNFSHNVRNLYFVLCVLWEKFANEWLQMILTDGGHQTIFPWNMVKELAGISVNVSQDSSIDTVGYVKQGVGIFSPNGTGSSPDQPNNVQSCLHEAW